MAGKRRRSVAGSGRRCPRKGGAAALVVALAAGESPAVAGRKAGVSERTVRRRLEDADFRAEVAEARSALVEGATGQLAGAAAGAVATLRRLLRDRNGAIAVAAARTILRGVVNLRIHGELADRVSQLEHLLATKGNGTAAPGSWRPSAPPTA